jgi:hypothetical protein
MLCCLQVTTASFNINRPDVLAVLTSREVSFAYEAVYPHEPARILAVVDFRYCSPSTVFMSRSE